MSKNFNVLWTELGLNIERHNELKAHMAQLHKVTHLSQKNRPARMKYFDEAFHGCHGERVAEIKEYRDKGGKSLGTFCIYVPDEIAYAADVLTFSLCGGSGWSVDYANTMFPRDICPLIRSTFGMALSDTCPYKTLEDGIVGETTCDAKKKTWDLIGATVMEVPQKKNREDQALWLNGVYTFKEYCENLSGVTVTPEKLKEGIQLYNKKRLVMQRINEFRKLKNPPITGCDALLIAQISLNHDIHRFIDACEVLIAELQDRVDKGISAYQNSGPRIMIAGTPSPLGNAKVHHVIESSGMQIVVDESCTGTRYFKDLVDENPDDLDGMMRAIAGRYMKIDCPCFSPNTERIESIVDYVKEYRIQGVVQNILSFCHGFNVEAQVVENALNKIEIPSLKIVTDYSFEDVEQIKVRVESFAEILTAEAVV